MMDTYDLLRDYKRVSIIGMEKCRKTTVLNQLIEDIGTKVVGLTSIGR